MEWQSIKQSLESRINKSLGHTGEKEFNGFKSPLRKLIQGNNKYVEWRTTVFKRDNYKCRTCNKNSKYLNVHHIISYSQIIKENNISSLEKALACDELWDINNGITLCKTCHKKLHSKKGLPEINDLIID